MAATGLLLQQVQPLTGTLTAGTGYLVEHTTAGPRLLLSGGVRAYAGGGASLLLPAVHDLENYSTGISDVDSTKVHPEGPYPTLARVQLGTVSIPDTTSYTQTQPTGTTDFDRTILTYTNGGVSLSMTVSRLTPAVRINTTQSNLRVFGGNVIKRAMSGSNITAGSSGLSLPRYVAYRRASDNTVVVEPLSGTAHNFPPLAESWCLVWWGAVDGTNGSHMVESTMPATYMLPGLYPNDPVLPTSRAYQADSPTLFVFGTTPTSITRNGTDGGVQFAWSGSAGNTVVLPLYGREKPPVSTTQGWSSGLPDAIRDRCTFWARRLYQYPETVVRSHDTTATSATITETFSYTTVHTPGGGAPAAIQWAPIPPMVGIARHANWSDLTFSGTIVDGSLPTECGPSQGIDGTNVASWTLSNLGPYLTPRPAPGGGERSTALQAELDNEIDRLAAKGVQQPWLVASRPRTQTGGDFYFGNPAEAVHVLAEILPVASSSQQTALSTYISNLITAYPLHTSYDIRAASASNGDAQRNTFAGVINRSDFTFRLDHFLQSRVTVWNAWAFARQCQVRGITPTTTDITNYEALWDADDAERDWANLYWYHGTNAILEDADIEAVANAGRLASGALGLYWIASNASTPNSTVAAKALAGFVQLAVLRVACAHYPRWQSATGLVTYPTDLGNDWQTTVLGGSGASGRFDQFTLTQSWATSADDPRTVARLDQFHTWLDDSTHYHRMNGYASAHLTAYRDLTWPVAQILKNALGAAALVHLSKVKETEPDWYAPWAISPNGGEHGLHPPMDAYQLFLADAWIADATAETLDTERGWTWLSEGGDEFYLSKTAETLRVQADGEPGEGPTISNINASSTATRWETWEVTFDLDTVATNLQVPYDASPPSGVTPEIGVSVVLELSTNGGATWTYQRPCFVYQPYDYVDRGGGQDWYYPNGAKVWKGRFSPPTTGTWHYRITATDSSSSGPTTSGINSFTAGAANAGVHGFLQVAAADKRYFQYEDGAGFVGFAINNRDFSTQNPVQGNTALLASHVANGMEWGRFWLSGMSLIGNYALPWRTEYGAHVNEIGQTITGRTIAGVPPESGTEMQLELWVNDTPASTPFSDGNSNRFAVLGWGGTWPKVPCKENTTYRISVRYNVPISYVQDVGGEDYGFVVKYGGWLMDTPGGGVNYPWRAPSVGGGTYLTGVTPDATADGWKTMVGTYTTGAGEFLLPFLYMVIQNAKAATGEFRHALISTIAIEELDGSSNPIADISPLPSADVHTYYKEIAAYRFDRLLEVCESEGYLLRVNVSDKNDAVLAAFDVTTGTPEVPNEDNFYGSNDLTINRGRWWQRAYWRYLSARYGASRAIHSWELLNEGNPFHGGHYNLAKLFAQEIKSWANAHMVTTSTWASHPAFGLWANTGFSELDYSNVHIYCAEDAPEVQRVDNTAAETSVTLNQPSDWADTVMWQIRPARLVGTNEQYGTASVAGGTAKPVVRSETDLTETGTGPGSTERIGTAGTKAYHKYFWAHVDRSGMMSLTWWNTENGNGVNSGLYPPGEPDNRTRIKPVYDFLAPLNLHQGGWQDSAASIGTGGDNLRVFGQKHIASGKVALWLDNQTDTWQGGTPTDVPSGTQISIPDMPAGTYQVTWIDTTTGEPTSGGTVEVT